MIRHVILLGVGLVTACACEAQMMPPKVVEVAKAARHDLMRRVRLYGTVRAKHEVTFLAEADGVLERSVDAGQKISKDNVFATLNNPELKKSYDLAQSNEQIALEQSNRAQKLLRSKLRSQRDSESDRARWIEATQASLKAKLEFNKTRFVAPFDGVLGVFKVRQGAYMQKGDTLVTLYDPSSLVIEFDIPAKYMSAPTGKAYIEGRLYDTVKTQQVVDTQTNTSPAYVELTTCDKCMAGMVLDVDLVVEEIKSTLSIPAEALFMDAGQFYVFVVQKGKAVKRAVTIGIEDGKNVEVRKGLRAGEDVVSTNPTRLSPDVDVRVAK